MSAFRCSLCERDLKRHCAVPSTEKDQGRETCGWWRCANQACTANLYDVHRGILVHHDGRVERLGS